MSIQKTVLAFVLGHQIIFDEDDEEEQCALEKVEHFAEETVPHFTDMQFKQHFRMSPQTFEDYLRKLHTVAGHDAVAVGHPEIALEKEEMIALWCLANMESFR
ncbi:hypothetical protein JTB14_003905 [Gonioctena quinquepunctata]|nr:hypothetical protein JTB14_003905 [Gonioctena quinquepunctata]